MTRTLSRRRMARRSSAIESLETRRLLAFVVNTTLDETVVNATTSLREAIQFATANSGDDTIIFDAAVFDGTLKTITLGSALSYTSGSGKLFINGPGQDALDISGGNLYRVLNVGASANLMLNDLTITKGFDAVEGGGIHNLGTLTLNRVTVELSKVTGAVGTPGSVPDTESTTSVPVGIPGGAGVSVRGAGIFSSGTLTATDCFIQDNEARAGAGGAGSSISAGGVGGNAGGAGIYTSGPVHLFDTFILENHAFGGAGGNAGYVPGSGGIAGGGGIFGEASASIEMDESRVSDNIVSGGKGGTNSIGGPTAGNGGPAFGGGINSLGSITLEGEQQGANYALGGEGGDSGPAGNAGSGALAQGGGVYIDGLFAFEDTQFASNNARAGDAGDAINANVGGSGAIGSGGGVYLTDGASGSFLDVFWHQNQASGGGGGTTGAAFLPGVAGVGQGGGIYNLSNDVQIIDNGFQSNRAVGGISGIAATSTTAGVPGEARGGAIAHAAGSELTITGGFLLQNTARGGQVYDANNSQTSGAGRGGAVYATGNLVLDDVNIDQNESSGGVNQGPGEGGTAHGGAIAAEGDVEITDCKVTNNSAEGADSEVNGGAAFGGAIECDPGTLTVKRSTFFQNHAAGGRADAPGARGGRGHGGAIYGGGDIVITDSTIDHNTAEGRPAADATSGAGAGGGDGAGGGIWVEDTARITNSTLYANDAIGGAGGDTTANALGGNGGNALGAGIFSGGTLTFINATVAHNIAEAGAAGVSTGGGAAGTAGLSDGGGIYSGVPVTLTNTIVANNSATSHPNVREVVNATNSLISNTTGVVFNTNVNNKLNVDPDLGPLQDNGGPTETALPNTGSQAINNGNNAAAIAEFGAGGFDQRGPGFPRIVAGIVDIGAVETSNAIKINFQPEGAPIPGGFLADFGKVFGSRGNGFSYGWNLSAASFTRDRNILSDQARDTLVHTQAYGNRTWEISVPNGAYTVHLVAGDAQYFNSVYKINVEGVLTVNGTPTSGNRFIEGTQTVVVSDGKLTISNASGASNNKIDFIEITPAAVTPIKINFQPSGATVPGGYLADSGQIFGSRGNGFSYGWNQSASSFTRDRNSGLSTDQRFDTLIHTQLYGSRTWELSVPNGTYSVHLVAGDPDFFNSVYKYNLEGILALSGTPTSGNRWIEATKVVTVSDGKLTLTNAAGASNNKIAFIDVTPL